MRTSFLVSMAGKELSKSSRSLFTGPPDCWAGADVKSSSPPNRSSSPSWTVAVLGLLSFALKSSASSPRSARSRARKSPCPDVGRTSVSPAGIIRIEGNLDYLQGAVAESRVSPESMSSIEGNRSAMLGCQRTRVQNDGELASAFLTGEMQNTVFASFRKR